MGHFSAEMWWGQTTWWPSELSWNDGGVDLSGFGFGQTTTESCGFWGCTGEHGEVRIYAQFFLGTDRMPTGGCTFLSNPSLLVNGTVVASTGTNQVIWDDPQATCYLDLQQTARAGDTIIARSQRQELVVQTPESNNQHREKVMAPTSFEPLDFELNRDVILEIDLEVAFRISLDGEASVGFSSGTGSVPGLPFIVRTPQWSITSVP